ncbi:aminotransferase class I/II-fold pyridoxal phosphate-dependent enzyme [Nocardia sp. NEAU-G5]|uniref:8-amino-7-oxononanoate synthase n=1 Tax=Nocardia albiluteola TaxID=2842303 RepID=A0ABS6B7R3_9NOCA|nr:aminotransferase class I/II-fold pyridoxal phosphate-dependent enzyme [Nocardia albiluteola]MBU3066348.1 aminotransferase class I/II-fold pyridoxal phosphate-dependent enzyme [Nocardia albiluteola]
MVTVAARIRDRIEHFYAERATGAPGTRPFLHGRRPTAADVVLTGNDYLALAGDRDIAAAAAAAAHSDAAAPQPGPDQSMLERRLARYMHAGAGVVCQSGWDANLGLLQAIADPRTQVHIDAKAHMSLRQGAIAAGAPIRTFRHHDPGHLRAQIATHGPGIIAVDAICSTSGSHSPLPELCRVAEDTGSVLVVDESHSLGIDGPHGTGTVVALGLTERVAFRTASLAKAFAGRAGFIAVHDPDFVDYFRSASYPAVFSSALRYPDIVGLAATLDAVRAADDRRTRVHEVSIAVRKAMADLGFDLSGSDSQIVAVPTGPETHALRVRDILERHGVLGAPFCAPATPSDRTLIRFSLHAALTDRDVDRILMACNEIRYKLGAAPPS